MILLETTNSKNLTTSTSLLPIEAHNWITDNPIKSVTREGIKLIIQRGNQKLIIKTGYKSIALLFNKYVIAWNGGHKNRQPDTNGNLTHWNIASKPSKK